MDARQPFDCYLMGTESLLISCADVLTSRGHTVLGVISDDPGISDWCGSQGLRVIPPAPGYAAVLAETPFDYLFSITNLRIVPAAVLALPRRGAVNFHDGPLPRYGGLYAPAWALMDGASEHGITWHEMTAGVDEGRVLLQRRFAVGPDDTSLDLNTRCFEAGIDSFPALMDLLENGAAEPVRHTLDRSTWHGLSDRPRGHGWLDWDRPARELAARVRALDFGPYANPLCVPKIVSATGVVLARTLVGIEPGTAVPGTIVAAGPDELRVAAADGTLVLSRLATMDGAPLDPAAALIALGVAVGEVLPPLDAARADAVDDLVRQAVRHEGFWTTRLSSLNPPELPYADRRATGGSRYAVQPLGRPGTPDATVEAFMLFLARLTGRPSVDVAFAEHGSVGATGGLAAFMSPYVPFRVELDEAWSVDDARAAVAAELATVRSRRGFFRDAVVRQPALKSLAGRGFSLPVSILLVPSLEECPAPAGDLVLCVATDGTAAWSYDADVLAEEHVAAMALQFSRIAAARDGTRPWTRLPLLDPIQLQQVLEGWNATQRDVPLDRCVHQLIEAQVARTPESVAIVFEDAQITYAALDARANQLAHHLRALGAGADTLVGLCCARSIDMVVGMLGILKAGAAYVPMDPAYPEDRIALMLDDAQVRIVVTQESVLGELPVSRASVVCLDRDWPAIAAHPAGDVEPADCAHASNLAYCIYTSGSTGRPKGVMVEHRNVVNFFAAMDERLGTEPGTWLAVTSLSFDISVLELLWTLARGYKVVLYADENRAAADSAGLSNMHRGMHFGLFYFSADEDENRDDRYRMLMEGARYADEHGFNAVWTPERHFHAFGGLYPNASVTSAAVAAITKRVGVRAGSCVLPLHHPARVVEEWSVVDNISRGRVGISFAAGWQPDDFVFQPQNYEGAKQKTVEMIDTVRRLWRGETISFPGPRGDVAVRTLPRPVQPELPIWFTTAGNPESYELAGTLGANVLTHLLGQTVEELGDRITLYRKARKAAGHAGPGEVALMLHTFVGSSDAEVKELVRAPMKAYLATSINLIKGYAAAFPTFRRNSDGSIQELDFKSLSGDEMDALLEYSFERYYETSGLFGTVDTCARTVDRLKGIGVDEIACLVDIGVDADITLRHLKQLNRLRSLVGRPRPAFTDYSIAALIANHGVTHLQCTPSMAGMLVADDRSRDALRSLATVCIGGEAFPPSLATELRRVVPGDIFNMYGPTETTVWSAVCKLNGEHRAIPLGTPIANNEMYVLDAFRQPVPPGVAGELYIGGRGVVRGYWRRPELTAERFVSHAFGNGPRTRLYRTGDLVRWTHDGTLEFLGRTDFQVKIRGYRIELGEIEAAVASHSAVRECVVMARTEGDTDLRNADVRLVAYVVWHDGGPPAVGVLRDHLRGMLPEFMIPSHFATLRDLPRTPNAKVDRRALPAPDTLEPAPSQVVTAAVAPTGELETMIAGIWQDVLKVPRVAVQDNFFDLGGHSLLAVQVHSRLKQRLGRELSITDLFRFPTIRGLATFLGGGTDAGANARAGTDRAAMRRQMAGRRARPPLA
jgi:natural product biosynthesis luciferase-like monooxygenase protein